EVDLRPRKGFLEGQQQIGGQQRRPGVRRPRLRAKDKLGNAYVLVGIAERSGSCSGKDPVIDKRFSHPGRGCVGIVSGYADPAAGAARALKDAAERGLALGYPAERAIVLTG